MSRCVANEAPDKLLRLIKVTSPEKYGCRIDQGHAQIDRVIALGGHLDHPPRRLGGAIRKPDQPVAARERDQRANLMIVAKEGDLRGVRGLSFGQAEFAVAASANVVANQVVGDP